MIGPRHMGSSPTLKRSLSRLSSSSSFQVRQSNSRIYTFLIAGGLVLLATVALLQVHLLRAPQGSKLSPLENGKSDEGVVPVQAWWNENDGDLNLATGKERAVEKSKLGRKMGAVQVVKDGEEEESSDEDMDVGNEMEDDGDEDVDQQDLFDIDIDDRMLEEEAEDLEDPDLGILAEMSDDVDSAENPMNDILGKSGQKVVDNIVSAVSAEEGGGERVDSVKSVGVGLVNNRKGSSIPTEHDREELVIHESKHDDRMVKLNAIPDWVLDVKSGSRLEGIVDTLQKGLERDLVKGLEKRKGSFFWDHALGVRKRSLENVEPLSAEETKDVAAVVKSGGNVDKKHVAAGDEGAAKVAMQHLRGFKEFVENWKERFNSDDELLDDNVQQRLEGVREIEDALLLNGDGAPDKPTSSKKFDALLKKGRGSFDRMNPTSNPMLQDPDTPPGTWMTKTDKEMLRAMRGDRSSGGQQRKALLRGNILDVVSVADSVVSRQASTR